MPQRADPIMRPERGAPLAPSVTIVPQRKDISSAYNPDIFQDGEVPSSLNK